MAASTRSGLSGGFSGGGGPTDVQSARTLYGHDLHLERAPLDSAAVKAPIEEPGTDRIERPITREEETAPAPARGNRPSHGGKSRFPALARLFGRWNTQGEFEVNDDELDSIPRERLLRPLAIVAATAAISFFIVVGLFRLRDTTLTAPPVATPAPVTAAPAPETLLTPPSAPAPRAAAPVAAPPRVVPDRSVPAPSLAVKATPAVAPLKRSPPRRPRQSGRAVLPLDPDGPMPLGF